MTTCAHCVAIMWIEERVRNNSIGNPRFNLCCQSGQVSLPVLLPSPPYLKSFCQVHIFLIRLEFTTRCSHSLLWGGRIDNSVNDGRSAYVFRISGSNHHKIGTLLPSSGFIPKFAQLYTYDTSNELSNRLNAHGRSDCFDIRCDIVQGLQEMLDSVNP